MQTLVRHPEPDLMAFISRDVYFYYFVKNEPSAGIGPNINAVMTLLVESKIASKITTGRGQNSWMKDLRGPFPQCCVTYSDGHPDHSTSIWRNGKENGNRGTSRMILLDHDTFRVFLPSYVKTAESSSRMLVSISCKYSF